ncbi:MAG: hypothetical protein IJM59_08995 [Proteobacteria bacterium]|nr:hypothetical protein [Pseudomonadota bacterium]
MKKTAWLFAALSICACSFTACGGDDDKDETPATTTAQEGQACGNDIKCADGLTCNASTNKCEKTSGTPAADDSCKGKQANDVCGVNKVCDANLKCVDKAAEGGDKAQKGEDCSSKACAEGLICGDDKKCAEKPADGGDKAQKGEDCSSKACDAGLKCDDASKKCVEDKGGEGGEGDEACKGKKANDECGTNKVCDANLKCVDKEEEFKGDAECKGKSADDECGTNKVCDKDLKCVEKTEADVPCDEDNPCANKSSVCNLEKKKCVKLGDCNLGSFVEFCTNGGNMVTCQSKKMTVYNCANQGEGLVCHTLGPKDVQCVEFCKKGDPQKKACIASPASQYDPSKPSTGYIVEECKADANGNYIYFEVNDSEVQCHADNICVNGACITEGAEVDCQGAVINEDFMRKCDKDTLVYTYTSEEFKSCNNSKTAKVDCKKVGDFKGCVSKGDDDASCSGWH